MIVAPLSPEIRLRTENARLVLLCLALLFALLSAGGVVQAALFSEYSTLKYSITVVFSLYLIIVISAPKALLTMAVVTAAVAPFAATATLGGLPVTLGLLALLPAAVAHMTTREAPWLSPDSRRSSLALAVPCVCMALALPLLHAAHPAEPAITLVSMVGAGWLAAGVAKDTASRMWIAGGILAGTTVSAGLAIYEFTSGKPLDLYGKGVTYGANYFFGYGSGVSRVFRPTAGLPDPNSLGNLLALSCVLALALGFMATNWKVKLLLLAAGMANATALAMTLSRMSWIAAAIGIVVTIALFPRKKMLLAFGILVAACVPAIVIALAVSGGTLADRFSTVSEPTAANAETRQEDLTRIALWEAALDVTSDNQFVGVGIGNLPPYLIASVPDASDASHAHSTYLNVAAEAGVIGLIGVLFVMFSALKDGIHGLRHDRMLYAGLVGSVIAMLVFWSTDYTTRSQPVAMLLAMVIGLCAAGRRGQVSP